MTSGRHRQCGIRTENELRFGSGEQADTLSEDRTFGRCRLRVVQRLSRKFLPKLKNSSKRLPLPTSGESGPSTSRSLGPLPARLFISSVPIEALETFGSWPWIRKI